jgi:2-iminoacetate synthase ThiH
MLYGHVENDEDRVDHLMKLRDLQDETGGFQTFIPLAFHPDNTPLQHLPKTTGMLDLKQIAVEPPGARQLPAHQVVLANDDRQDRADCLALRG